MSEITKEEHAQVIFDSLNIISSRLNTSAPASLPDLMDTYIRVKDAVEAINALAGTNMSNTTVEGSVASTDRLSLFHVVLGGLKNYLNIVMKGRPYTITMESQITKKQNKLSSSIYDLLATVVCEGTTYFLVVDTDNQYLLTKSDFWQDI